MFRLLVVYWFLSTKIWECNSQSVKCDFINDDKVTTPGTCIKLNDCAVVKQRFKEHNTVTEWCPNGRKKRIVCCPFPEEVKVRSHSIRTSVKKCQEYALKTGFCGQSSIPLIVGGDEATDKEFPHMALIGYRKSEDDFSFVCGGSLISDRFILSAAHCSFGSDLGAAAYAKIGDVRRGINTKNTLLVLIMERIKHPDYKRDFIDHDIMLFKLQKSVEFNDWIRPICLPHINEKVKRAVVTGWGTTGFGEGLSKNLLKVTLEIFNQTDCQSKYSQTGPTKNAIDEATKICAGSYLDNKDSCGGDSGGPLQIYNRDNVNCMYTIIGVVSYGQADCGAKGVPGIYTRVFPYLEWIEKKVWP